MSGEDLMLSINCAIYEEQRKAYNNMESFDRDNITIMATAKAIHMITAMLDAVPFVNFYPDRHTKCFGCNLKMIDGEDVEIYLARKIPIITAKLSEEGAKKSEDIHQRADNRT